MTSPAPSALHLRPSYVSVIVSDLPRALAFYRTLGLPIPDTAHLDEHGQPCDHAEITVGGLRLAWETEALMRQLNAGWTASTAGRISVAFEADTPAGVDAACWRLRAAGYTVSAEPYDAPWGQRYVSVHDPDGTAVDVFAWQTGK